MPIRIAYVFLLAIVRQLFGRLFMFVIHIFFFSPPHFALIAQGRVFFSPVAVVNFSISFRVFNLTASIATVRARAHTHTTNLQIQVEDGMRL